VFGIGCGTLTPTLSNGKYSHVRTTIVALHMRTVAEKDLPQYQIRRRQKQITFWRDKCGKK
jgi:hypothetical protein